MRVEEPRVLKGPNQTRAAGIGTIDEAVLCETPEDYDGVGSRAVIAQVLRPHLEPQCLTASEVLYGSRQLRQIMDQPPVVEAALARVAMLQGRLLGQDAWLRRTALQAAVDAVVKRSRSAEAVLSKAPKHLTAVAACLGGAIEGAPLGPALLRAALARDLAGLNGWMAKLDHLLGLFRQCDDQSVHQAVDEVIADLLGTPAVERELVGPRATLGATLCRVLEMILGRIPTDAAQADRLATLSQLFRQDRLPAARLAVVRRLWRQLKGREQLQPGQPDREHEVLRTLIAGLIGPEGVIGDHAMAEVLTSRYARRFDQGGSHALRRAMTAISEGLGDLITRVHYLAAVVTSEQAPALSGEVISSLEACLSNESLVEAQVFRSVDLVATRAALARAAAAVAASALPAEARSRLARRVEEVAEDYLMSGALLPRLAATMPTMARQALRLAELVSSGLIANLRALAVVRQRLFELLRQPGLEAELLAVKEGIGGKSNELQRFYGVIDLLRQLPADVAAATVEASAGQAPAAGDVTVTVARPIPLAAGWPQAAANGPTRTAMPPPALEVTRTAMPAPPRSPTGRGRPPLPSFSALVTEIEAHRHTEPPSGRRTGTPVTPATVVAPAGDDRCVNCFALRGGVSCCPECGYQEGVTARSMLHLAPGTWLVGRYRTGKLLGQGGFGATYLGWDDRLQVKVAVKEFFPVHLVARVPNGNAMQLYTAERSEAFAEGIHKFLDEARTLARLRDVREIVGVQDYFEDNGTAYLVMELLQGQTMKKYIADQGGKIDYRKALSILMPIMKALHEVHELGLVHRDISPDNIFMSNSGGAKLLDFGAAREAAGAGSGGMTVILKPGYAPPEQYFSDSRQGPWTDVYALSATFYCAITGRPPADSTKRVEQDTLALPSAVGIAIPPELEKVLLTGLALGRRERYQSMKAMLTAISKVISG
jgi:hypothetical protein